MNRNNPRGMDKQRVLAVLRAARKRIAEGINHRICFAIAQANEKEC